MDYKETDCKAKIAWLRRYQGSLRLERRLRDAIKAERARCEATTAALTGMPHAGAQADTLGLGVSVLLDRQQQLAAQLVASEGIRREIEAALGALENPLQAEALTGRYVDGLAWWQVANRMHISERHVRRLHNAALKNLQRCPSMSALAE